MNMVAQVINNYNLAYRNCVDTNTMQADLNELVFSRFQNSVFIYIITTLDIKIDITQANIILNLFYSLYFIMNSSQVFQQMGYYPHQWKFIHFEILH